MEIETTLPHVNTTASRSTWHQVKSKLPHIIKYCVAFALMLPFYLGFLHTPLAASQAMPQDNQICQLETQLQKLQGEEDALSKRILEVRTERDALSKEYHGNELWRRGGIKQTQIDELKAKYTPLLEEREKELSLLSKQHSDVRAQMGQLRNAISIEKQNIEVAKREQEKVEHQTKLAKQIEQAKLATLAKQEEQAEQTKQVIAERARQAELAEQARQAKQAEQAKHIKLVLLCLALMFAIAVFGLYQHKRGIIVVFSNYTDVLCTILTLITAGVILIIARNYAIPQWLGVIFSILPVVLVATATFACNRNIFGFLLSLYTKFFMVTAYVVALIIAMGLLLGSGVKREKGEADSDFEARQKAEAKSTSLLAVAVTTGVFSVLVRLALRNCGFVSFRRYISGATYEQ